MSKALRKVRKNTIATFKKRKPNLEEDIDFLWPGVGAYGQSAGGAYIEAWDSGEDGGRNESTSSISTYSTNATTDDLPGPGRLLDKYIYQRGGRIIERFVMKWNMSTLHPAHIVRYLSPYPTSSTYLIGGQLESIIFGIENIHGPAVVARAICWSLDDRRHRWR